MKNITTDKGDIGVAKVTADLIQKGYPVFIPVSATSPFDLLIFSNNFKRVQVKYRAVSKIGTLEVVLRRRSNKKSGTTSYKNNDVDLLAIYCPETDKCYYIDAKIIVGNCINLRINNLKENRIKGVKFANDYLQVP